MEVKEGFRPIFEAKLHNGDKTVVVSSEVKRFEEVKDRDGIRSKIVFKDGEELYCSSLMSTIVKSITYRFRL